MADIVARVLALLKRDLRSLRVEPALPTDLPAVNADAVLIEQVLINLIRNAADELLARPTPGQRPHIRISAVLVGQRFMRVDVDDNGPGLQGRGIEQLTTAFYSTKPEGMGMGLAICRSVIEAHHGGMEAGLSDLGGARLSFTVPLAEASVPRAASIPTAAPPATATAQEANRDTRQENPQ